MPTVRAAGAADAGAIARLLGELGYAVGEALVVQKLWALERTGHDAVLVAQTSGVICGVAALHTLDLFHCDGRLGRVTALVVASNHRRAGIGGALMAAAESFFLEQGCVRAEVTSGNHRIGAHGFYEAIGYSPDERRFVKSFDHPV